MNPDLSFQLSKLLAVDTVTVFCFRKVLVCYACSDWYAYLFIRL